MLLNEAYDYNEINRWIIDQATILNNKFIHNIILIIIGGSSSNSNNTLYIIQNVKDYITITIILSDYDSINNDHSSGYLDRSRSSSSSNSSSRSSHLHQNISCKGLYYDTKSWRYLKIYMNTYRKKKYSLYHNHAQQQQQHNSHYSDEYHSNYKNNLNQEVGMIMMNFIKRNNKLHISSDVFVI